MAISLLDICPRTNRQVKKDVYARMLLAVFKNSE